MSLEVIEEFCLMEFKIDTEFEGNWYVLPKMTWGVWQIFTRAPESLKIGTLMTSFFLEMKMYEMKIYRGVMCHENLKWNWLVSSKETWGIWWILTWALKSFKNLNYYGLRLTKVYVWAEKVERSYVWWYWILMQNLMENWLVLSKMTWGFLQIFTRAH